MPFDWTPPDPLNNSAITRSIYITELQDAANIKRAEISQSSLSYIDQSIGEVYLYEAVEELKEVVNQLALDFGYSGGVENAELLGRPYSDHPTLYGSIATGYNILNDLRQVLDLLEVQVTNPQLVVGPAGWYLYDDPATEPTIENLSDDEILVNFTYSDTPYTSIPIFAQGIHDEITNTVCSEGPPTCDNTISGVFNRGVADVTNLSIYTQGPTFTQYEEGPLGGPYFTAPLTEADDVDGNPFPAGLASKGKFDKDKRYTVQRLSSPNRVVLYTRNYDGSTDWTPTATFTDIDILSSFPSIGFVTNFIVGDTDLFFTLPTRITMIKKDGSGYNLLDLDYLGLGEDLLLGGESPWAPSKKVDSNASQAVFRNGFLEFVYVEAFHVFNGGGINDALIAAAGIAQIAGGQTTWETSDIRDLDKLRTQKFGTNNSKGVIWLPFARIRGSLSTSQPIVSIVDFYGAYSEGIWSQVWPGTPLDDYSSIGFGGPSSPGQTVDIDLVYGFEGDPIYLSKVDYKGDRIPTAGVPPDITGTNAGKIKAADAFVSRAGAMEVITDKAVPTITNRTATSATITVTSHITGAFRYKVLRRRTDLGSFSTIGTIQSYESPLEIESTGMSSGFDYEFRIDMETAQGEIIGDGVISPAP